jgi:hypothetical protein
MTKTKDFAKFKAGILLKSSSNQVANKHFVNAVTRGMLILYTLPVATAIFETMRKLIA